MLEFLGDALGAIISGGATGLLGSSLSIFAEYKKQKMVYEHEEQMRKLDHDELELKSKLQMELAKVEGKIKIDSAEMDAFVQSHKSDRASYTEGQRLGPKAAALMAMVDFVRGMIRPSLTIYMAALVTLLYLDAQEIAEKYTETLDPVFAINLVQQSSLVILYVGSTIIMWWFGTRQKIIKAPKL